MKTCPNCGAQLLDDAAFCTKCGTPFPQQSAEQPTQQSAYTQSEPQQQYTQQSYMPPSYTPTPAADPFDHTSEFTDRDISDNKVMGMLCYLMGPIGIILALLGSSTSPYAAFHVRQALKITVMGILISIVSVAMAALTALFSLGGVILAFLPGLALVACGLLSLALVVVRFICFFSICMGQAKEPPIIRSFGFLR